MRSIERAGLNGVIVSMVIMYVYPQIVFYLPELFYGG